MKIVTKQASHNQIIRRNKKLKANLKLAKLEMKFKRFYLVAQSKFNLKRSLCNSN